MEPRKMKSLSGQEVEIGERDFALLTIANVHARGLMANIEGEDVIGIENAIMILQALEQANVIAKISR